jgi:hypothetical protein
LSRWREDVEQLGYAMPASGAVALADFWIYAG